MSKKEIKTNAVRILEKHKIPFELSTYEVDEFVSGMDVAKKQGLDENLVYKTLVTIGKDKNYYVFVIPTNHEIDFKKAAKVVGVKALEMIHVKDLTKVTGYIRGGTTAIGMKKEFPTYLQETAKDLDFIYISGGRPGTQIKIAPKDLVAASGANFADVV